MKLFTFILLCFTLTACSFNKSATKSTQLHKGDYLVLNQNIKIIPGSTRTFIQHGQITTKNGFDRSDQHCRIEIKDLSVKPVIIQPGRFEITGISNDEEQIAYWQKSVNLAFNTTNLQTDSLESTQQMLVDSFERPETMDLIRINLYSPIQPDVMRLTCAGALSNGDTLDDPNSYRPNFDSINKILGKIAQIKITP